MVFNVCIIITLKRVVDICCSRSFAPYVQEPLEILVALVRRGHRGSVRRGLRVWLM